MRLGFVGVGAISQAMVEAVLTGPRAEQFECVLSPRNAERVSDLAQRFASVTVAADNQAVLDACDLVFIAVLPTQIDEVCKGLKFRAEHVIGSLIAGRPPATLREAMAPATQICQMIPLPAIAMHIGPIVISPPLGPIVNVLDDCGDIVGLEDETKIRILSCASAMMSPFLEFQNTVINWSANAGLPREVARDYATSLFKALAIETAQIPIELLDDMPAEHETPGGLNEHMRLALTEAGVYAQITADLEDLYLHKRLSAQD